jgi:UDP-N-acetylmuramoyl-tripeptide--D-alanyl-D-alanine ligase
MRELGTHGDALHAGLAPAVLFAKIDNLILIGEEMAPLEAALAGQLSVERVGDVDQATAALQSILRAGDAVLVKASNAVGLAKLVERVAGGLACSM